MRPPIAIAKNYSLVIDENVDLLTRIQAAEALRIHLYTFQATLVEEARSPRGQMRSWRDIGQALGGITKQAAQQRFAWAKID